MAKRRKIETDGIVFKTQSAAKDHVRRLLIMNELYLKCISLAEKRLKKKIFNITKQFQRIISQLNLQLNESMSLLLMMMNI